MTNFVPEVVAMEPAAAVVVVATLDVETTLEVVTGGLVTTVLEEDGTTEVLMVVATPLDPAPATH